MGKILLSTPSISNEYLNKSMVYICSHDKSGAMGIVVNKLIPNTSIKDIFDKLNISSSGFENFDTYFGGAEEINRCFILHSDDYLASESTVISNNVALTINADIIRLISSSGHGPEKKILCMGCCLWDPDQLENEVASSYWIPIEADEALIFGDPKVDKWSKALLKIGFQTNLFMDVHGNA
ncbi:MAG: YqgE/AlgH family protein [Holosporaceae bacterium]|nr:YqgE/AlgH family protein [Holosporaceae bacterium]